jgi:hypothetical protein
MLEETRGEVVGEERRWVRVGVMEEGVIRGSRQAPPWMYLGAVVRMCD